MDVFFASKTAFKIAESSYSVISFTFSEILKSLAFFAGQMKVLNESLEHFRIQGNVCFSKNFQ